MNDESESKVLAVEEKPESIILSLVSANRLPRFYRINARGNLEGKSIHPKSGMLFMEEVSGVIMPGAVSTKQNRYQRSNISKVRRVLKGYGLEIGAKVEGHEHLYEIATYVKRVTVISEEVKDHIEVVDETIT